MSFGVSAFSRFGVLSAAVFAAWRHRCRRSDGNAEMARRAVAAAISEDLLGCPSCFIVP